jgi:phosphatidylglycerol---prolipoprotein diacylglyceryl transferase
MISLYIIWDKDPAIFTIGNFHLMWYPVLIMLGFCMSYFFLMEIFRFEGISREKLDSYAIFIIAGIFIVGRLVHCLVYEPQHYLANPWEIIIPWKGELGHGARFTGIRGLSGHGSALGLIIFIIFNALRTKMSIIWMLDRIAIFGPLVGFFTRIGNLMNSEIIGVPTKHSWGFIFVKVNNLPRHPAQLYEALTLLSIFILVYLIYRNYRDKPARGTYLGLVVLLVYSTRFFIEFIKEPQTLREPGMLIDFGQILSIPFVMLGVFLLLRPLLIRKKINQPGYESN